MIASGGHGLGVRRLLLCGSGGVAAALLPAWVAWIRQHFAVELRVVLSRGAESLVSPKALAVLTRNEVLCGSALGDELPEVRHIEAARWPDAVLVAPATANLLARLAQGVADDLLTTVLLACEAPIVLVPSLPPAIAAKPATRRNIATLANDGFGIVPTVHGVETATANEAAGAMADAPAALAYLKRFVGGTTEAA
jgi:phosphopantothenoylcysteine decarboxylase/phosphopantothenate--cysteine ligase